MRAAEDVGEMSRKAAELIVINSRPRTEYVTREVNVHEHRAPTDESVRLLAEMEKAADAKRIASMELADNTFRGYVERFQSPHEYKQCLMAIFDLNGQRVEAKVSVGMDDTRESMVRKLVDETSVQIARTVLLPMLIEMQKRDRFWT